jgi:hypothetical protein
MNYRIKCERTHCYRDAVNIAGGGVIFKETVLWM